MEKYQHSSDHPSISIFMQHYYWYTVSIFLQALKIFLKKFSQTTILKPKSETIDTVAFVRMHWCSCRVHKTHARSLEFIWSFPWNFELRNTQLLITWRTKSFNAVLQNTYELSQWIIILVQTGHEICSSVALVYTELYTSVPTVVLTRRNGCN